MAGRRTGEVPPPDESRAARRELPHHGICRFHGATGVPEVTAVLEPRFPHTGLAVLVRAATVAGLRQARPKPRLPRRDPDRRHRTWPRP